MSDTSAKAICSVFIAAASFLGCGHVRSEVADGSGQWGTYAPGAELRLLQPAFVLDTDAVPEDYALSPDRSVERCIGRRHAAPAGIEHFRDVPAEVPLSLADDGHSSTARVVGIAAADTRIKIQRVVLVKDYNLLFGYTESVTPVATMESGRLAGTVVDIADLSIAVDGNSVRNGFAPNPHLLAPASASDATVGAPPTCSQRQ